MPRFWTMVATFVLLFPQAASAQIINGSFETPVVPVGSFTNFTGGSTAITGWTVVGVDSAVTSKTFMQSGITFQSQDGNQWIDLAGVTSNSQSSGVTQSVTTTIGATYLLSFYVGSATGGGLFFPATIDLSINGGSRVSYFNPTAPSNMLDWRQFAASFTATTSSTSITFFNGSAPNNFLSALDNVTLTAVPEPSSLLFGSFVLGSVMIVVVAKRYRKRDAEIMAN